MPDPGTPEHRALRERVIATARALNPLNLNRGKAGNVSVRVEDGLLVTPSGVPYDALAPGDIAGVRRDGTVHGARTPSSEWRMHRAIYDARPDIGAIVHAHPPFSTALACLDRGIPPFHYMISLAGGDESAARRTPPSARQRSGNWRSLRSSSGRPACCRTTASSPPKPTSSARLRWRSTSRRWPKSTAGRWRSASRRCFQRRR